MSDRIEVRGARTHNLKNVSLDIPRDSLVVVTGPSGSGKSSLAFDTLYAEGERRYVESLSPRARQFLEQLPRADVDAIEGLPPAVAVGQAGGGLHPRSTVGTLTEADDHLRLLFARAGTACCPTHGLPLAAESVAAMTDRVLREFDGLRLVVTAPVARGRTFAEGEYGALVAKLLADGWTRVRIDGVTGTLDAPPAAGELADGRPHDVEVAVDRLRVRPDARERIAQSIETALELGGGIAGAADMDSERATALSSRNACPLCDFTAGELEPGLFSRFSRRGACPHCGGAGVVEAADPARLVADSGKSLAGGALAGRPFREVPEGVDPEAPWRELPETVRAALLERTAREIDGFLADAGAAEKRALAEFLHEAPCPACGGSGLGPVGRCVRVGTGEDGVSLPELEALPASDLLERLKSLEFTDVARQIADRALAGVRARLECLVELGLGYLPLARAGRTLSGGELERIRLAAQLGSGLAGVLYVLDEPTTGLHPRDVERLIGVLRRLRAKGNTVLVVEHDRAVMEAADRLVDLGPGAGELGGRIVAEGSPAEVMADVRSITGAWLAGRAEGAALPARKFSAARAPKLTLRGATGRNLRSVDLEIPVGGVTVLTGVSGSGKSTLAADTLAPALRAYIAGEPTRGLPFASLEGAEAFDRVVCVDQSPIGRSARSNAATFTGAFTPIRELFAETLTARERGYGPARFSLSARGGRCEACAGEGAVRVPMQFLPDLSVVCEVCGGRRYNRETLECLWQGRSMADVLDMTVAEARELFAAHPQIVRRLDMLFEVGLGYVRLGQSTSTFSGGEAQRLKLAAELAGGAAARTLYLLDEPTTGLHFADVRRLIDVLRRLADDGGTVLVVEHDMLVAASADRVVDMGPGAGAEGGRIVASGTPAQVARSARSPTALWLAAELAALRR